MSIRLRFTLLYNGILLLTLAIFGFSLYTIQAQSTLDSLKKDLLRSSEALSAPFLRMLTSPPEDMPPPRDMPPPMSFDTFSNEQIFQRLPEREIVRVSDASGNLIASPFGRAEDALPLSSSGLQALNQSQEVWETAQVDDANMLIYSRPVIVDGQVAYILQIARPLTERDRSLQALASTLVIASLVVMLLAFGIGWVLSGYTLAPIHRITRTAQEIGAERDFTRRVSYTGPQDEVGRLAGTFNIMLSRLEEAYERVAHALALQKNFVADVSHELRTPLTTLRGNLGLMGRSPSIPSDEQRDVVNDMVEESDRLIRLVNDLLVLARADVRRSQPREQLSIYPLLEEVRQQAVQLDPQRKISLDVPLELIIMADQDGFKQVMLILLDNAIKHSEGDISICAGQVDSTVEIRVSDKGSGISPDKLAHVFERFYRGNENPVQPGFGLGLPIARSIVEGWGGTIRMESEPGKGSVVIINF